MVDKLVRFAFFIAKNSDKSVNLPTRAELRQQIRKQVKALNRKGYALKYFLRLGADIISEKRLRQLIHSQYAAPGTIRTPAAHKDSYVDLELGRALTGITVCGMFLHMHSCGRGGCRAVTHDIDCRNRGGMPISESSRCSECDAYYRDETSVLMGMSYEHTPDSVAVAILETMDQLINMDFGSSFNKDFLKYRDYLSLHLMKTRKPGFDPWRVKLAEVPGYDIDHLFYADFIRRLMIYGCYASGGAPWVELRPDRGYAVGCYSTSMSIIAVGSKL